MRDMDPNELSEDRLINGGFLAVCLLILLPGITSPITAIGSLISMGLLAAAVPLLAFNAFIIEYKKRFQFDIDHRGYNIFVFMGYAGAFVGLLLTLLFSSGWLAGAFIIGISATALSTGYLDKIAK